MTELVKFHILAHIFISLIGGILLLALWINIKKKLSKQIGEEDLQIRVDKGLLNISLAVLIWVISGCWKYLGYNFQFYESLGYNLGVNVLSILNNLLFFLALFYFYYAPAFFYNNKKTKKIIFISAGLVLIGSIGLLFSSQQASFAGIKLASLPDFIFSVFLSIALIVTLFSTFVARDLKVVALISVASICLIIFSQLPEVFLQLEDGFSTHLIQIIAKTALITVFLVLSTTWVIQIATRAKSTEIKIKFVDWSVINLTIPSKEIENCQVDFGSKTTQYHNLLKFALRRKFGESEEQYILVGNGGEIVSQTYLSRIIENLNSLIDSKEDKLERRDLFTFVGQGKYRLRVSPENIQIDPVLLQEFINQKQTYIYKQIVEKQ